MLGMITGKSFTHEEQALIDRGIQWKRGVPHDQTDLKNHFQLRRAVLKQAVNEGRISEDQISQVKGFRVNFTKQLITFEIPGIKERVVYGFEDLNDGIKPLNYLISKANREKYYHAPTPMLGTIKGKGNPHGLDPLQRKTAAANKLTKSFDEARTTLLPQMLAKLPDDPAYRQKIVKRLEHAEFLNYRMLAKVESTIEQKNQVLGQLRAGPQDRAGPQIARLNAEIEELTGLRQKFERLDVYALTMALIHLPVGKYNSDQLNQATGALLQNVEEDLLANTPGAGLKARLLRKEKTLDEADRAYAKSVAGLLHKTRGEYNSYCRKQNLRGEKEGLEDVILREAVRFADGGKHSFSEKKFEGSGVLEAMPRAKKEVIGMFDLFDRLGSTFDPDTNAYSGTDPQALAMEIANRQNGMYPDVPEDRAPAREHWILNGRNGAIVTGIGMGAFALQKGAEKLGYNLPIVETVEQVGQRVLESPSTLLTPLSLIPVVGQGRKLWQSKEAMPFVVTSGLALGTGILYGMGSWDPSVLSQMAFANPAGSTLALSTAYATAKGAYDWINPVEAPATGLYTHEERKFDPYRAVMAAGGLAAAIYFGADAFELVGHSSAATAVAGVADWAFEHYIVSSIGLQVVGQYARRLESTPLESVGKVITTTTGILGNVASMGGTYEFVTGFASRVGGWLGLSSDQIEAPSPPPVTPPAPPPPSKRAGFGINLAQGVINFLV